MQSSSGAHFIALDHVRALASFMVVTWHFTHGFNGYPIPFEYTPEIPVFAVLNEGHTGVALFMTLSGYLFAKLLDGKAVNYRLFLWNRLLRLLPLLVVVLSIVGAMRLAAGQSPFSFIRSMASGLLLPTLPNGGWSITVELHFYILLPLLLKLVRRGRSLLLGVLLLAILLRLTLYTQQGTVHSFAYWTLGGRIDQFVLGILMYEYRGLVTSRHGRVAAVLLSFSLFYWYFDARGGFFLIPSYPSSSPIWVILPTLEGFAYAVGIAWYDTSFSHSPRGLSYVIGKMGQFSYCTYLVHFFLVFDAALFVHERVMDISNFYLACLWAALFFVLMLPIGYASFYLIEQPFLRLRKKYVLEQPTPGGGGAG